GCGDLRRMPPTPFRIESRVAEGQRVHSLQRENDRGFRIEHDRPIRLLVLEDAWQTLSDGAGNDVRKIGSGHYSFTPSATVHVHGLPAGTRGSRCAVGPRPDPCPTHTTRAGESEMHEGSAVQRPSSAVRSRATWPRCPVSFRRSRDDSDVRVST